MTICHLSATYEEDAIWDELDRQQRDELGTEPDPGIPQSNDIGPSCSGTLNHQANTGSGITSVQDDQQFDQASFGNIYLSSRILQLLLF